MVESKKANNVTWYGVGIIILIVLIALIVFYYVKDSKEGNIVPEQVFVGGEDEAALLDEMCSGLPAYEVDKCIVENRICEDDRCYYDKAMIFADEDYCMQIEKESLKLACGATLSRSERYERSVVTDDITVCEEFEDEAGVTRCYDNYYLAKSRNNDDMSYCSNIVDSAIKEECLK